MNTHTQPILLAEIFSNLGQMVWSKDIQSGKITFLTSNFSSFFELPMDILEMNPGLLKSMIHPEDQPYIDLFSKSLLSNQFEQLEYRILTQTQKEKWVMERKQLVKNELGEIIRLDVLLMDISDQKMEESRLLESETTFKSLFYSHFNPMWVYDPESLYFLAVNDAAIRFYGYTHDEFFRMTVKQIRPKEDVPELLKAIRANNFDEYREKTWRHVKKDGSIIYVKLVSNEIRFRGKLSRLVQVQDITREIEAENQTIKAFNYLERFQEAVSKSSLLALLDDCFDLVFVNENLIQKIGNPFQSLIGKNFSILFSNIYNKNQLAEMVQTLRMGKIWTGERKLFRQNGPHFWVRCSIIPIQENEFQANQFLILADDISALKEAEKRSKEYAIRLHNIIEGITDAIFVLDRKWHLTNLNQAAVHLLGKKRIDLIEKNIWELLPEEVAHRIYQFFRKAKKRKVTVEFEEYFEPQEQWFDISLYPSSDGLAVCFRNVSERRKKDEERKELMEQLIIQNRDLEEFTYIASHSLRAQIANISMLCSAIDNGGLTPSNQEIFDRLFQSSSNLDTIISDLNTILTIKDRGSVLWELVSFQNTYINVLSRLPQNMAPFKKHIRLEIDPEVAIFSVRNYLETLLLQIITNSIRFRAMDKEPDILVKAKAESGQIVVTISDNGRGFDSQKVQKQLFQLYKTFHPGLSGKGLGLYLSKILADELQAIISIESHTNTGTKVAIHFPIKDR